MSKKFKMVVSEIVSGSFNASKLISISGLSTSDSTHVFEVNA